MRRLGVYGDNLPTKSERSVDPADFGIAGLVGKFDRKFYKAFKFRNTQEAEQVLGIQTNPSAYGWDAVNGFFANLRGNDGSLYVLSYPGTSAVQATSSVNDQQASPQPTITFKASYQTTDEYGASGNRTGFTITRGSAFSSAVTTLPTGTGDPARVMTLQSVVGVKIGDVVKLSKTGYAEYHFVTAVDETARTVTWADADYAGTGVAADYTADVVALQIKTYRKDTKGVVSEVSKDIGALWCTFNSADADKYIENVFAANAWLFSDKLAPSGSPTADKIFPADVTTVTYLASGADGTEPATAAAWTALYHYFDTLPVRFLANVETSVSDYQIALETYAQNRATKDNPVVFTCGQYGLSTKAAVSASSQLYQRSSEVDGIYVHNWYGVSDPFAASPTAPRRAVPNSGHLMGWYIAGIATFGIHAIPARKAFPVKGVFEVYGYTADDDMDRTDLANAGANVTQNISGYGIIVRNLFTESSDKVFKYANAILMRNYIKVSGVDSLQESENTPNDIGHVREDRTAMINFMHRLWVRGSNGNIKLGETFGQFENSDGTTSTEADAYEVIADASNNSVGTLQAGERNIDTYFSFPAPCGSLKVGVGLIYRVN